MSASKHTSRDIDELTSRMEELSPSSGSLTSETSKKLKTFHYDGQWICGPETAKVHVLTDVSAMCKDRREVVWDRHLRDSFVLSRELFAKICRAELVALKVAFDEMLIKFILQNRAILAS